MIIDMSLIFPIGILLGFLFGYIIKFKKEEIIIPFLAGGILLIALSMDKIENILPFNYYDIESIIIPLVSFLTAFLLGFIAVFILKIIYYGGSDWR